MLFSLRKYKYNNSFCKKKAKKIAHFQEKMTECGFFTCKIAYYREFFVIFVR